MPLRSNPYLKITRILVYILLFLTPLFFFPISLDVLEINKQTLLVLLTFVGALFWIGSMIKSKTFIFKRGYMNLFPPFLLVVFFFSSLFSKGKYLSWIGGSGQEYVSMLSIVAFVVLFYLIVNIIDSKSSQRIAYLLLIASGFLVGIIGLCSMLGIPLIPFDFAKNTVFNTIGTLNAFGVYMAALGVFANTFILIPDTKNELSIFCQGPRSIVEKTFIYSVAIIALITLIILDYWVLWTIFLIGFIPVFAFAMLRAKDFSEIYKFILPFLSVVIGLLFLFLLPSIIPVTVPAEVSPSFGSTWNIAIDSLGDNNFVFGSGPGTFGLDYAKYHSSDVNTTLFWNTKFDKGASYLLTILATVGIFGVLAWLTIIFSVTGKAVSYLLEEQSRDKWLGVYVLLPSWVVVIAAMFLYSSNFTLSFMVFVLAGLLGSQALTDVYKKTFDKVKKLSMLFSVGAVFISFIVITGIFISTQRYLAEAAFAKAVRLDREGGEITEIIDELDYAAQINQFNDIYYRNLGQAFLLQVSEELVLFQTEAPSEERRNYVQALTAASIDAAKRATTRAPNNVLNWYVRGSIYRDLMPLIGNSGDYAIEAFEKVIELEPSNPLGYHELGQTYAVVAESHRQLTAAEDTKVKNEAQAKVDEYLKKSEAQYLKAIELKNDYAPAHYQLAIVLERMGRLDEAVVKMEEVAVGNQSDVGVAFQLGLLYLRRAGEDDLLRAQFQFERAIAMMPSYSNARWFLSSIYEQQDNLDAAIEQVSKVLELNPDNAIVSAKLERLKEGKISKELPPIIEEAPTATDVPEGQPVE